MLPLLLLLGGGFLLMALLRGQKPFSHQPVNPVVITQRFRKPGTRGPDDTGHNGVDFDLVIGQPLFAVSAGQVHSVGNDPAVSGLFVVIHGLGDARGFKYSYSHCSAIDVVQGQIVKAGEQIARGGNTGNVRPGPGADGSHLHFRVQTLSESGAGPSVDPLELLPA